MPSILGYILWSIPSLSCYFFEGPSIYQLNIPQIYTIYILSIFKQINIYYIEFRFQIYRTVSFLFQKIIKLAPLFVCVCVWCMHECSIQLYIVHISKEGWCDSCIEEGTYSLYITLLVQYNYYLIIYFLCALTKTTP